MLAGWQRQTRTIRELHLDQITHKPALRDRQGTVLTVAKNRISVDYSSRIPKGSFERAVRDASQTGRPAGALTSRLKPWTEGPRIKLIE